MSVARRELIPSRGNSNVKGISLQELQVDQKGEKRLEDKVREVPRDLIC